MANYPSINIALLKANQIKRSEDGISVLPEDIDFFLTNTPLLLTDLEECIGQGCPEGVYRAAHLIKLSAIHLGAIKLAKLCEDLEIMSHTKIFVGSIQRIFEAKVEYERTKLALQYSDDGLRIENDRCVKSNTWCPPLKKDR